MTRRHFQALADGLKDSMPTGDPQRSSEQFQRAVSQWRTDCETIADACRSFNARFDRDKFLRACGTVD